MTLSHIAVLAIINIPIGVAVGLIARWTNEYFWDL